MWVTLRDLYKVKGYSGREVKWCDIVDINFARFKTVDAYGDYLKQVCIKLAEMGWMIYDW